MISFLLIKFVAKKAEIQLIITPEIAMRINGFIKLDKKVTKLKVTLKYKLMIMEIKTNWIALSKKEDIAIAIPKDIKLFLVCDIDKPIYLNTPISFLFS